MKKEVNSLLAELGKEPEYKSVLEESKAVVSSDKAGGRWNLREKLKKCENQGKNAVLQANIAAL